MRILNCDLHAVDLLDSLFLGLHVFWREFGPGGNECHHAGVHLVGIRIRGDFRLLASFILPRFCSPTYPLTTPHQSPLRSLP